MFSVVKNTNITICYKFQLENKLTKSHNLANTTTAASSFFLFSLFYSCFSSGLLSRRLHLHRLHMEFFLYLNQSFLQFIILFSSLLWASSVLAVSDLLNRVVLVLFFHVVQLSEQVLSFFFPCLASYSFDFFLESLILSDSFLNKCGILFSHFILISDLMIVCSRESMNSSFKILFSLEFTSHPKLAIGQIK